MFSSDDSQSRSLTNRLPVPAPVALPIARLNAYAEPMAQPGFEFGLLDLINALWKRKWLLIGLPLICATGAALYARSMPNTYDATAQLLIDPRELRVLDNKEVVPQGFSSDSSAAYIESQARIITSSNMMRRIVEQENLTTDTEFVKAPSALDRWLGFADVPMDNTLVAAATLAKKLEVRRGEKTFVVDITVNTEDADKSARLANVIAAAYLADQVNSRGAIARRTSTSLTGRLTELQTKVRDAEDKVEAYRREKNIVDTNGKRVTEEQLAAVNSQLSGARSRLADARSKLEQIERLGASAIASSSLPEAVNSPTMGILRQQLGDAERRAANLATTLGSRHPDFIAARAVQRDAERAVQDEITRIRAAARVEFQRATSNEQDISKQVDTLKVATLATSADSVRLRELQREVEASRALYQAFLSRSLETGEQEGLDSTNTRIITEAVPPLEKAAPNRKLFVALGGFLGAALAACLAILLELIAKFRAFSRSTASASTADGQSKGPVMVLPPAPQPAAWQDQPQRRSTDAPTQERPNPGWSRQNGTIEFEPEQETYTELVRIMRKIEQIEDTLRLRRQPA